MKKITLLATLLLAFVALHSQNCEGFFPMKSGSVIETKSYTDKGKITATSRQTVLDASETADGLSVTVKSEQFDEKDQPVFSQELGFRCKDDVFYMDMKNFLDPATMGGMKDMEMKVDGIDLEFPSRMQVGETLKDGNINLALSSNGMTMMNMKVNITNRNVEAYESITTPAGTFDCFKISYDVETKVMMKVSTKATEWVAKNVGVVKSESYDKKGKLTGYTLLTKFEN